MPREVTSMPRGKRLAVPRRALALLGRFPLTLRRKVLAGLVLALLQRRGVELRALASRLAPGRRAVLLRNVDADARAIGEAEAGAVVGLPIRALERFDAARPRGAAAAIRW